MTMVIMSRTSPGAARYWPPLTACMLRRVVGPILCKFNCTLSALERVVWMWACVWMVRVCGVCVSHDWVDVCVKLLFPPLVLAVAGLYGVSGSLHDVRFACIEACFPYHKAPHLASHFLGSFKERSISSNAGERDWLLWLLGKSSGASPEV